MLQLKTDFQIALRNLQRHRGRTAVAVLTVAAGLIAFLLAGGFIEWIFENMRESTIRSQLGHIQIVRPGYLEKGIADPYRFLLPTNSPEQKTISERPTVVSITERLAFSGLISHGDSTASFIGEGVDPENEARISDQMHIREGSNLAGINERTVVLGEGLAKTLGVTIGDRVVLFATTAEGAPSAVEVTVVGTFFTASKEFDDTALRLPLTPSRKLMRVTGATSWVLLLKETSKTNHTVDDLISNLSSDHFQVVPWFEMADFYNKTVSLFSKQTEFMKVIIGLIIILTISNTQTMSVLERTTEIGTMLAMGTRTDGVLRLFIIEGVTVGVIGGFLGATTGFVLSVILSAIGIPMPPPPGMDTGFTAGILVTPALIGDSLVLAFVTTLLASILPAHRASRLIIVDALRANQP
jgi:putative ABC transport system permease protein